MSTKYLVAFLFVVAICGVVLARIPLPGAGSETDDEHGGFPENTPVTHSGQWEKLFSAGGDPSAIWVWKEGPNDDSSISLRKLHPQEGETVEEVAEFYSQGYGDNEDSDVKLTKISEKAAMIEKMSLRPRTNPNFILKIFQRGEDIWMFSMPSYNPPGERWEEVRRQVMEFAAGEH